MHNKKRKALKDAVGGCGKGGPGLDKVKNYIKGASQAVVGGPENIMRDLTWNQKDLFNKSRGGGQLPRQTLSPIKSEPLKNSQAQETRRPKYQTPSNGIGVGP